MQLLDQAERAEIRKWGGDGLLSGSGRWAIKIRGALLASVDRLVDFQEEQGAPNPREPLVLAELMAVVLRYEADFLGYFEKRNPANPDWDRLRYLMSRTLLEKWIRERQIPVEQLRGTGSLVPSPEYVASLMQLLDLAKAEGLQTHQQLKDDTPKGEWALELEDDPTLLDNAAGQIRTLLSEHEDLAQLTENGDIPLTDQEREIEKAALLELRFSDLKDLAEDLDIPLTRDKEKLADAILARSDLNREAIAKLVLDQSADGFDHGPTTHLIALGDQPDLGTANPDSSFSPQRV